MYLHDHHLVRKKRGSFSDCLQSIAKSFVEKDPTDTLLKFLSEENERSRRHEMQMMQFLIQNQNRPAFSPDTQMLSVTPTTYNYQHGSSVTSQVTFPASSTLSSSDISQHQMPSTSRNDLENQRRDTSSFKRHWPY